MRRTIGVSEITLALAGDTMLGRGVGERLARDPSARLVDDTIAEALREADLVVLNLECCISARGSPFPDPAKPFFFRAPPPAADLLAEQLHVAVVTLANNHALDYGPEALLDTLEHLQAAGVAWVGAGATTGDARAALSVTVGDLALRIVALSDHPAAFAAGPDRPGIAYADLASGRMPEWLRGAATRQERDDAVLVLPHWGPNMCERPLAHVRAAAAQLMDAGAALVAGHSAHVFQGVDGAVLFDLGDFIDDYAVDRRLRNDLGLLWFVRIGPAGVGAIEALPLKLEFCFTRAAGADDARTIEALLRSRCAGFGTDVRGAGARLAITAA